MEAQNDYILIKKEKEEEIRSAGGIILNIPKAFDFKDEFTNKNTVFAEIESEGHSFYKKGDRVVVNTYIGNPVKYNWEDYHIIREENILAKCLGKDYQVGPTCVLVKISKEDTDALYSKWIKRDDGQMVQLFTQAIPDKRSVQRNAVYVCVGEIMQAGDQVKDVLVGDTAILDFVVDNNTNLVLYYDDFKNKYVVVDAVTTYHLFDRVVYADRNNPKDTLTAKEGDFDRQSELLGVISDGKLKARRPYVFINHEASKQDKITSSGIVYTEKIELPKREVLSASKESEAAYGVKDGDHIAIRDMDIFTVKLKDRKIDCVHDLDILGKWVNND